MSLCAERRVRRRRILRRFASRNERERGWPMLGKLFWNVQYVFGRPRWDTGITPPELVEVVEDGVVPRGRALDIGCGTGTNAIYLAKRGFQVVGTDIAWLAIRKARQKARDAGVVAAFYASEATKLGTPDGPPLGG